MAAPHESATARLARLLTVVPYLVRRQGVDLAKAARELGVSVEQLEADLRLIFLCGYGQLPDELIEAEWESGKVFVSNADLIARPLRLAADEAATLIVGLRTLLDVPGLEERDAVERALAKITAAAGPAAAAAESVRVDIADDADPEIVAGARRAIELRRRLHLRYLVMSRDEATERDVDPMGLVHIDGHWYLEGWCHRAQATRTFRLDRVEALEVLEVDGTPPPDAPRHDFASGAFRGADDDLVVTLRLAPGAHWVSDYYPVESVTDGADGTRTVTLRTGDTAWLRRLVWRMGGSVRILAPESVALDLADGARQALAAYGLAGSEG
jgi:proteasome accessory factor C